ncbi:MAG: sarcosine oxidase subunit gamma [Granulosicoccus sp.]
MSIKPVSIVQMDQFVDVDATTAGNVVQTPLAHAGLQGVASDSSTSSPGTLASTSVSLLERPVVGLLTLRAVASKDELNDALQKRFSINLPATLSCHSEGDYCVRWISPDEWLLSCPLDKAYAVEHDIRELVGGSIAIVNVSGAYSILELEGKDAINVLKKSTPYDVSEKNFSTDKVVNTTFAKTQLTLRVIQPDRYELIVRRSYADYLWLWLQRAGKEYTLQAHAADT